MSVRLYVDVHVPFAITTGLRLRGVDVLTAQADGATRLLDSELLDRAMTRGRVLFSQDQDLLRIARKRQGAGQAFGGLIYAHQMAVNIGTCVADLEIAVKTTELAEWRGQIVVLPL